MIGLSSLLALVSFHDCRPITDPCHAVCIVALQFDFSANHEWCSWGQVR